MGVLVDALRSVLDVEFGNAPAIRPVWPSNGDGSAQAAIVAAAARHKVIPVIAPHAAALGLPAGVAADLGTHARELTLATMAQVADTVHVTRILGSEGIPHLVLKGPALAVQTTGSPLARGSGDVDLLVRPADVPRAVRVLDAAGIRMDPVVSPDPDSPLFGPVERRFMELVHWVGAREVDLHWRLDLPRRALDWPLEDLLARAEPVELGGTTVPTLGRTDATIFNATHGTRDAWSRLRGIVDHARLLEGIDPVTLAAAADSARARTRVDVASLMVARLMGSEAPAASRRAHRASSLMWRWLLEEEEPRDRRGVTPGARLASAQLLLYDSPGDALERSYIWVWPTQAMATRALGAPGDRYPWLYAARPRTSSPAGRRCAPDWPHPCGRCGGHPRTSPAPRLIPAEMRALEDAFLEA
jgi:hypothetical protein